MKTHHINGALQEFSREFNCAQSVLKTFGPQFDLADELASGLGRSFGAGMGCRNLCGAVSASLMILGMASSDSGMPENVCIERCQKLRDAFLNRFQSQHSSCMCHELINVDLCTPEGMNAARQQGVFSELCPKFIESAVVILSELLDQVK